MIEATTSRIKSVAATIVSLWRDPAAWILYIDLLTILLAALLPWSTSGFAICMGIWIISVILSMDIRTFLSLLKRPVCLLPLALFALALLGTLWSDVPWDARLYAVKPVAKFLALPFLLYHFERTSRGAWVFVAFLISCLLLMIASWVVMFDPNLALRPFDPKQPGVFVKNYIDQSQAFALCAVALAYPILTFLRRREVLPAAILAAIALSFFANMLFVVVSRTALVTLPILLVAFALIHMKRRAGVFGACISLLLAAIIWNVSPHLRSTVSKFVSDYQETTILNETSGVGSRLEFWRKSLRFFVEAPVLGHGTGSTRSLFEQAAVGQTGYRAEIVANPHNQTLNVAVQWGLVGVVVLYAMWLVHLMLFRGDGLAAWIGLLVVLQNILTSLFNSHLFDFQEGWLYVLGVGIAGGMILGPDLRHQTARGLGIPPKGKSRLPDCG